MPRASKERVLEKRMSVTAHECMKLTGERGMWNQEASSLSAIVGALNYLDARGRQTVWESVKRIFPGEFGSPTNPAKTLGLAENEKERT